MYDAPVIRSFIFHSPLDLGGECQNNIHDTKTCVSQQTLEQDSLPRNDCTRTLAFSGKAVIQDMFQTTFRVFACVLLFVIVHALIDGLVS